MRKYTPEILANALRILAQDIRSPDDIPFLCLMAAAGMIEEQQAEIIKLKRIVSN